MNDKYIPTALEKGELTFCLILDLNRSFNCNEIRFITIKHYYKKESWGQQWPRKIITEFPYTVIIDCTSNK